MNNKERVQAFLRGEKVDHPPFMPLAIEWVAKEQGIDFPTFVYDVDKRVNAYINCAKKYNFDCILPDSDFYEQLEDYGVKPEFNASGYHIPQMLNEIGDYHNLKTPSFQIGTRMGNRIEMIKRIKKEVGETQFIIGTCIGPWTEYCNARTMEEAMYDIYDEEDEFYEALDFFKQNCKKFIELQLDAGADGIQIVDPASSLVSPNIYQELILPIQTELVETIQKNGAVARLHMCGDINHLIKMMLTTGTKILDADWQVDLKLAASLLSPNQYICGNLDPSNDVLLAKPEEFKAKVNSIREKTNDRIIISAGCDIPPATSRENMIAFYEACLD